ncbi:hypothetical protein ALC62_07218, partial [Cyphomyrmex costatus]
VSNSFIGVNNIRGSSISPAPTIAPSDTPLVVSLAKSNIPGFSSGKYNRALILNGTSVE